VKITQRRRVASLEQIKKPFRICDRLGRRSVANGCLHFGHEVLQRAHGWSFPFRMIFLRQCGRPSLRLSGVNSTLSFFSEPPAPRARRRHGARKALGASCRRARGPAGWRYNRASPITKLDMPRRQCCLAFRSSRSSSPRATRICIVGTTAPHQTLAWDAWPVWASSRTPVLWPNHRRQRCLAFRSSRSSSPRATRICIVGTTARYNRASPITKLDDQTDIEIAMGAGTWDLDRRANRWVTQGEIDGLTADAEPTRRLPAL
jgi:hypothetical protein